LGAPAVECFLDFFEGGFYDAFAATVVELDDDVVDDNGEFARVDESCNGVALSRCVLAEGVLRHVHVACEVRCPLF
jgi:hypothetical protein